MRVGIRTCAGWEPDLCRLGLGVIREPMPLMRSRSGKQKPIRLNIDARMSVNKVILLGNVGRDPEVRYTGPGQAIAEFPLATTERAYTNAAGVQVPERTEWHRIVMNGRNAEFAERYIRKGTKLYIEGKLRTRVWEDRASIKRYVTEVYVDTFDFLGRNTQPQ